MNKFTKKIVSVLASGSLIVQLLAVGPAFATTTITITGNGTGSDNDANVTMDNTVVVNQTNVADVYNDIDADAKTGGNDANNNTGGDVNITTGDAKTDVNVENNLNSNSASVDCCSSGDVEAEISGNGSNSDNTINLNLNQGNNDPGTYVYQTNYAKVHNDIDANAKTGKNDANNNTGGDVSITTGNADANVSVSTTANANMAQIGGSGDGQGGLISLRIVGNGTGSDNDITLNYDRTIVVDQLNVADVYNDIDADAKTGKNDANNNTGGDVSITTGDAEVDVNVDNELNFNWADLNCGCLLDVEAKIAGNGDSYNTITATLLDGQFADQLNVCGGEYEDKDYEDLDCKTDVDANAKTGKNDANDNTGGVDSGDPSIDTGDATSEVDVNNSGNVNVVGDGPEFSWPDLPDFPNFEFNFNMGWLWFFLGGSA